ncbi:hypothetical protein CORC01_08354 [Colletotrichum orchidophilum]|uniref:Uncharacterized protein n=1 Tax=Colletotrichum orchidophilum TaxID=1209926 RepID=A0A1G4B4S9_9PEZI|nr:uncharacterized protein CORC01_08354 [Colletotrichum orchidophilum]OHE96282.1 hypothetical protein CORC01_08354 [Colletotrichum orchidophilum]
MNRDASKRSGGTRRSQRRRQQSANLLNGRKIAKGDREQSCMAAVEAIPGLKFDGGGPLIIPILRPTFLDLLSDINDEPKKMSKFDHSLSAARRARTIIEMAISLIQTDRPPTHSYISKSAIWNDALTELRRHRWSWYLMQFKLDTSADKVAKIIDIIVRARKAFLASAADSAVATRYFQGFHGFLAALDQWIELKSRADAANISQRQNSAPS